MSLLDIVGLLLFFAPILTAVIGIIVAVSKDDSDSTELTVNGESIKL